MLEANRTKRADYIHDLIMSKDISEPDSPPMPDLKVLERVHYGKAANERPRRAGTTSWWHTRRHTAMANNTQRAQHRSMFHTASPQRPHDAARSKLFFDSI